MGAYVNLFRGPWGNCWVEIRADLLHLDDVLMRFVDYIPLSSLDLYSSSMPADLSIVFGHTRSAHQTPVRDY